MSEVEFGGMKFKGGKMFALLTALSTLGGALWGGFEFYKDYMDMKEIIQNIDIQEIQAANTLQLQKLDDAINYTVEIRQDLARNSSFEKNARLPVLSEHRKQGFGSPESIGRDFKDIKYHKKLDKT